MQSLITRKFLPDATHTARPFRRRYAGRCLLGMAGIMTLVNAAYSQGIAADEATLRPSYQPCVEASQGVTLALNDCIGIEYAFQDKRLNAAYRQVRESLPKAERVRLRDEERTWIAQRDKACAPQTDGGTAGLLDANQCQLDRTAARAAALEARMGH